jgi:hypothetical protein
MPSMSLTGLPALAWNVGFVVVASVPIWLAAKITGAENATLLRSAVALLVGVVGGVIGIVVGGSLAFLLIPMAFLLSFKYILNTSFLGSLILGILAVAFYFAMAHLIGGGVSVSA